MMDLIKKSVRALTGYIPGEQPGNLSSSVIKLNTNENPYPPSPGAAKIISSFDITNLKLYPDPDNRELRAGIASINGCTPEQVFVGNGADEILALTTRAFVEDNEYIGFFEPSYSLYSVLAAIRDVGTRSCESGPDFEWRTPDSHSTSLFFLTNPNAPTGIRYPFEEIETFCADFDGVVIIDEAYVAFAEADCMKLALEMENVLVVRSLSKSHSLAGLRLGYAVGATPLIDALFKIKDSYNLNRLTQIAGLAAILDESTVEHNAEKIKNTRYRFRTELEKLGFKVYPSEANFIWTRPAGMTAEMLFRELRKRDILVRHFPGSRTGPFLRITIGTDTEMDALLTAVSALTCRRCCKKQEKLWE